MEAPLRHPSEFSAETYVGRQRFILTDLVALSLPAEERIVVLDGGAREAFRDPRWKSIHPSRLTLHGFDIDAEACADLNRQAAERKLNHHYHALGLWSAPTRRTFRVNQSPGGSSLFPQNKPFTDRWKFEGRETARNGADMFYEVDFQDTDLTSLDVWAAEQKVNDVDFMKLNVQGAELEILNGAASLIDSVLGLQVEVSFVETYTDRPFFADLDVWLRRHGFMFFDLIGRFHLGRSRSPLNSLHTKLRDTSLGQLMEGHGVYFRDPIDLVQKGLPIDFLTLSKLLKLVSLVELYDQTEYAFELLYWGADHFRASDPAAAEQLTALADEALELYTRLFSW